VGKNCEQAVVEKKEKRALMSLFILLKGGGKGCGRLFQSGSGKKGTPNKYKGKRGETKSRVVRLLWLTLVIWKRLIV